MSKKKKTDAERDLFESHEDDFFAAGESDDFWTDEFGEEAVRAATDEEDAVPGDEDADVPGDENTVEEAEDAGVSLAAESLPTADEIAEAIDAVAPPDEEQVAYEDPPPVEEELPPDEVETVLEAAPVEEAVEEEQNEPEEGLSHSDLDEAFFADGDEDGDEDEDEEPPGVSVLITAPEGGLAQEPEAPPTEMMTAPTRQSYTPSADEAEQAGRLVDVLVGEASSMTGEDKVVALLEAARVALVRLGDPARSEALSREALKEQPTSRPALSALSAALSELESWEELRIVMEQCANQEQGDSTAAEYLQDAALLALHRLNDPEGARVLLDASLERYPEDYLSLKLRRDLNRSSGDTEAVVEDLERMGKMLGGTQGAGCHFERGRLLLETLERPEEGLQAFWAARTADPRHVPAFLALESMLKRGERWVDLAGLYESEAAHAPPEDAWYHQAQAARVHARHTGNNEAALRDYRNALLAGGGIELRHEVQVFLASAELWNELGEELEAEVEAAEASARPHVQYRLAQAREAQGDLQGALDLYQEVARNPAAKPASAAVSRLLQARGDHEGLLAHWAKRLEVLDDPSTRVSLEFRMGEICETLLGDSERARGHYERILDTSPGYLPALESLEQVYSRLEEWSKLAAIYEQRALLANEASGKALQFHRAAAVWEFRLGNLDKAREFYERALEHEAHFPPSLDAFQRILEGEGNWKRLAQCLLAAGESATDGSEKVSLLYRAGRIHADKAQAPDRAAEVLRQCLELSPGFMPALNLLKELDQASASHQELFELMRREAESTEDADRRHWLLLAAAAAGERLEGVDPRPLVQQVLDEDPNHPGARQALEWGAIQAQDEQAIAGMYRQALETADSPHAITRLRTMLMRSLSSGEDASEALEVVEALLSDGDVEGAPLGVMARLAESHGSAEAAVQAALAGGSLYEAARIREQYLGNGEGALEGYQAALDENPEDEASLAAVLRLQQQAGDAEEMARAHRKLAEVSANASVRLVHANLAGNRFEVAGNSAEAMEAFSLAFAARPVRGKALDALRRLLVDAKDAEGIRALHAQRDRPDSLELAEDLLAAGDIGGAIEALGDSEDLVTLLRIESALEAAEDWSGVAECLDRRARMLNSDEARDALQAKKAWLLSEKLQETDAAWDYFSSQHEQSPEDSNVLEALARIAGARGEAALALQYLQGLVGLATEADVIARYHRRIADVHRVNDKLDEARSSYLSALEQLPGDREALQGLRAVGEVQEDWASVVSVLAREAVLVPSGERLGFFVRIAKTWEDLIGDLQVATESWRKVLEEDDTHVEALTHLVSLTEQVSDHSGFVFHGVALLDHVEGAARVSLLRRVGLCYADSLQQETDAVHYLEEAAEGDAPDVEAARALTRIRESRGEWEGVMDSLAMEAKGLGGVEGAGPLLRAVKIALGELRQTDAAAGLYEKVLSYDPDQKDALEYLSEHKYRAGDMEGAVPLYSRLERGAAEWDLEDFDVQIEACRFYSHYAQSLIQLGQPEEAKARLEKALDLNGNHLPSLKAVGPLYIQFGDWSRAESVCRQYLQLIGGSGDQEELASAYGALGRVEWALGKKEKAQNRFVKALDLAPNDVNALRGMGRALYSREDWKNLLDVYNDIIKYAREPSAILEAYLVKGHVLDVMMGLPEKAAQHFEKARHYRETLAERGESVSDLDRLAERSLLCLGEISLRKEEWPQAANFAVEGLAISQEGSESEALLRLVRVISQQSRNEGQDAAEELEKVCSLDEEWASSLRNVPLTNTARMHETLKTRVQVSPF